MTNPNTRALIDLIKSNKDLEIYRLLQNNNIKEYINEKDEDGLSPLIWAIRMNGEDTVDDLLRHGASIQTSDNHGRTPLMYAAEINNHTIIEYLIKMNACVNDKDIDGRTPLFYAAKRLFPANIDYLIKAGACLTDKDQNGDTPLQFAIMLRRRNNVNKLFLYQLQITPPDQAMKFIDSYRNVINPIEIMNTICAPFTGDAGDINLLNLVDNLLSPTTSLGMFFHTQIEPDLRLESIKRFETVREIITNKPVYTQWQAYQDKYKTVNDHIISKERPRSSL